MLAGKGLLFGDDDVGLHGIVNYGYGPPHTLPTLNARAGRLNKYEELEKLQDAGVQTIQFGLSPDDVPGPVLGRNFHHTKGRDIVFLQHHVVTRHSDYFTHLTEKRREFRVWAFRRKCIGVYEKVLRYPRLNGRRGRSREVWNRRNGYAFVFVHPTAAPEEVKNLGKAAVDALGLDFGAADIIEGHDGRYYVLEVNTAPGVEGPRQALVSLVNHIEKWARGGFKRRNGDRDGE